MSNEINSSVVLLRGGSPLSHQKRATKPHISDRNATLSTHS